MTVTLFSYIQSELTKQGFNEFYDSNGELLFFDEEAQFLGKIFSYDEDIAKIVNKLFANQRLQSEEYDRHFKRTFIARFLYRRIGRQTIEAFKMELLNVFLSNNRYINYVYRDLEKYVHEQNESTSLSKQSNQQKNDGSSIADNRSAFANLPQNNVQIDVNNTVMDSATDNTITRNKEVNSQESTGVTDGQTTTTNKAYSMDAIFKTSGLEEELFNVFDKKCFLQIW